MNLSFVRSGLFILSIFSLSFAFGEENVPFPEVVHVEKAENTVQEATATSFFLQQFMHNPDDVYLTRVHNNTYYHVAGYSDNGDVVQLHDASKWEVHPSQCYAVLHWAQSNNLFIKPNASCFSSYKFVLQNYTTQQTVEVNLINPPLPMGAHTFRILNIEPYSRTVHLSDNTVWQVDIGDVNFPYWQIGQRLLIGLNNHWRTAPLPNILINIDMYNEPYSQANFYGYSVGY